MSAYILRALPHNINREDQFLTGRLSIGWPVNRNFQNLDRSEIKEILENEYDDISGIKISMVEQFVHMPKGSIILSPSVNDKLLIHIFKTTSKYRYDATKDNDTDGNPHYIEAEFLKTVTRKSLPNEVLKSLSGALKTLSNISQHNQVLEDFIK